MERRGGIELREAAGGLPHAWPANTHYKATPLPTTSGFLRYFRACSLSPVRQGTPRVPQGTWGVLWERNVCPYWMLMEFPISLYHWLGLLAHIPMPRWWQGGFLIVDLCCSMLLLTSAPPLPTAGISLRFFASTSKPSC